MNEELIFKNSNDDFETTCSSIYFTKLKRLTEDYFNVSCIDLAKNLLGTILVRQLSDGTILKGKIVETECYLGSEDKASQSYNGKKTPRNEPMFMKPGTLYVYMTYGMYYCINISSQGEGAAVLLRSVEPLVGLDKMIENRCQYHVKRKRNFAGEKIPQSRISRRKFKPHELCNGPSKLCISFDINIENCNKKNVSDFSDLWLEERMDQINESNIISSTRIGIESAGTEWASKLLRFYIYENKNVSIKDRERELLRNPIRNK